MALPATIHRVAIELADLDRQQFEKLDATVARHPSETTERLVLRLLAYALCYHEELCFTKGVCAGDEPDLWSKEPDGRIGHWIEVGLPDPERLIKASRHAARVVLLASGGPLERWLEQHQNKLALCRNLTLLTLEAEFIAAIAGAVQRVIDWSLTVTEGVLYLSNNDTTQQGTLQILQGER
ncbi:MAG: hypothetical protein C0621_05305 [Desulfuromonas sp.]|nr:MAG: hypothetical protein C0621_05305 [Desulfuromonas sp.]